MAPEAALADEVLAACFGRLSLRSQPRIARVSRRWRDAAALAFARRLRWRKKACAARLPLPVRAVPGRDAAPRNEILNVGFSLEFLGGGDLVVQVVDPDARAVRSLRVSTGGADGPAVSEAPRAFAAHGPFNAGVGGVWANVLHAGRVVFLLREHGDWWSDERLAADVLDTDTGGRAVVDVTPMRDALRAAVRARIEPRSQYRGPLAAGVEAALGGYPEFDRHTRCAVSAADGHFLFHVTTAAGAKVAASLPLPASIAADGAVDGAVPAAFAVRWPKDDPIARPGLSREKPCGEYLMLWGDPSARGIEVALIRAADLAAASRFLAAPNSSAVAAAFGRGGVEENIAYTRASRVVVACSPPPPPAVIVWDWETGVCLQAAVECRAGWAPVVLALRPDDESPYLVRLEGLGDCLAPVDSARVIRSRAGGEERRWNQRTCAFEVAASVSLALHPRAARVAVGLWHECKAAGVVYAVDFG
ncbi:hypothetical protein JL720_5610 [Aureococcus anophagefferens]|nr:hypothetical protein JL720_5610 [Aureococcus anophagefferens]